MILVSVILPTFNELENICPLIDELLEHFENLENAIQIIVVDDNSNDGTIFRVREKFANDKRIVTILRKSNRGLANSIREGIEKSQGETLIVMDTDFNHSPRDAYLMFRLCEAVDIVVGSRFIVGGGMHDKVRYKLSYLYNLFMRLALDTRIDDNLSGFFAIKSKHLGRFNYDEIFRGYGDYFFRLLIQSQKLGLLHVQYPVYYEQRKFGITKTRFLSVFLLYTKEVIKLLVSKIFRPDS